MTDNEEIKNNEDTVTDEAKSNEETVVDEVKTDEAPLVDDVKSDSAAPEYTWSFFEQRKKDAAAEKKKSRKGIIVYASVVTALFLICFSVLAVLLITGYSGGTTVSGQPGDRVIYVREYDKDSGLLTIPEVAAKCLPSTVGISITTKTGMGTGTGIIMSADGYIATNYHVIENAQSIRVTLCDGTVLSASYIGGDQMSDVALVKVEPKNIRLVPAEFGNSDGLLVGEDIIAIGNPSGMELAGSVTSGIVSAINRDVKIYDENGLVQKRMTLIQISANLNPGNSGGPLIDLYGRVVGINTMRLAETYEGIGFAIPTNGALKILNEIKETGHYSGSDVAEKGVSLGITCTAVLKGTEMTLDDGSKYTPGASGVMVVSIAEGASAEGHLKYLDIITAIDGYEVEDVYEIRDILFEHHVGDTVTLRVFRDGKSIDVTFALK